MRRFFVGIIDQSFDGIEMARIKPHDCVVLYHGNPTQHDVVVVHTTKARFREFKGVSTIFRWMFLLYATRKGYSPFSSARKHSHLPRRPQPEHAFKQLEAAQFSASSMGS